MPKPSTQDPQKQDANRPRSESSVSFIPVADSSVESVALQSTGPTAQAPNPGVGPSSAKQIGWPALADYQVLGELGHGGMGFVWRVRDRKRNRQVALKTIKHHDAHSLYRFKQEFRALADVVHPNLVSLFELISDGENLFFTMELVEGVNFRTYVCDSEANPHPPSDDVYRPTQGLTHLPSGAPGFPGVSPVRLRDTLRQLAAGLCVIHAAGKLHRDIKPSNVLVTPEGRVVILDFGLAGDIDAEGQHQSTEQQILGTVAYMAPEQAACQPVSASSDWYSVGVMLYEVLTGRLPFTGPALHVLQIKQKADPPNPRNLDPRIPEDLDALCVSLLRRNPRERPPGSDVLKLLGGIQLQPHQVVQRRTEVSLIGRERHLTALDQAFASLRAGRVIEP